MSIRVSDVRGWGGGWADRPLPVTVIACSLAVAVIIFPAAAEPWMKRFWFLLQVVADIQNSLTGDGLTPKKKNKKSKKSKSGKFFENIIAQRKQSSQQGLQKPLTN